MQQNVMGCHSTNADGLRWLSKLAPQSSLGTIVFPTTLDPGRALINCRNVIGNGDFARYFRLHLPPSPPSQPRRRPSESLREARKPTMAIERVGALLKHL